MRKLSLSLLLATIALAGCQRVSVDTKIAGDGSFTRTVKYSVSKGMMPGDQANAASEKPENSFSIPHSGDGVTVSNSKDSDGSAVTVNRSVGTGSAPLTDIVVLHAGKSPLLTSTVQVRKVDGGRLEYTETLHWTGPRSTDATTIPGEIRIFVKKKLPERFQTSAQIDAATKAVLTVFLHVMFGPSEPVLVYMMDPDLMELKAKSEIQKNLGPALQSAISGITDEEVRAIATGLINDVKPNNMLKSKLPAVAGSDAADASNAEESLIPLTFSVSYPGKILNTNGVSETFSSQVYWSLYSMVVEYEDVKLTLVVEPNG
jgi:hypothetical protein